MQSEIIKKKSVDTNRKKYGAGHPRQSLEYMAKFNPFKRFLYDDKWFDSSWEVAFYKFCIDNSIPIKRCDKVFKYTGLDGKVHSYFPDFIIYDNQIVEIKSNLLLDDFINGPKGEIVKKENIIVINNCKDFNLILEINKGK